MKIKEALLFKKLYDQYKYYKYNNYSNPIERHFLNQEQRIYEWNRTF